MDTIVQETTDTKPWNHSDVVNLGYIHNDYGVVVKKSVDDVRPLNQKDVINWNYLDETIVNCHHNDLTFIDAVDLADYGVRMLVPSYSLLQAATSFRLVVQAGSSAMELDAVYVGPAAGNYTSEATALTQVTWNDGDNDTGVIAADSTLISDAIAAGIFTTDFMLVTADINGASISIPTSDFAGHDQPGFKTYIKAASNEAGLLNPSGFAEISSGNTIENTATTGTSTLPNEGNKLNDTGVNFNSLLDLGNYSYAAYVNPATEYVVSSIDTATKLNCVGAGPTFYSGASYTILKKGVNPDIWLVLHSIIIETATGEQVIWMMNF
ncbi:hypothetical protein KAR91_83490 [Candidatus Pacearchaeota archaeon]|nr:hypothetical protein [Candidatus Pacearchaeota archaeon]